MVAMSGAIIPQPLAMPPSVKLEPFTIRVLGIVSVVRMPRAASSAPSFESFLASFGVALRMTSIGKGVPMIPVEQTRTCRFSMPKASAAACVIASASAMPGSPVPALALPELTMIALAVPPFSASRCAVQRDRRCEEFVLGEDGDRGRRLQVLGRDQGHVVAAALDPGMAAGGDEALWRGDAHGQTPIICSPALSSRPSIKFAHWIICPAAPFPRLSSAAMARTLPVLSS